MVTDRKEDSDKLPTSYLRGPDVSETVSPPHHAKMNWRLPPSFQDHQAPDARRKPTNYSDRLVSFIWHAAGRASPNPTLPSRSFLTDLLKPPPRCVKSTPFEPGDASRPNISKYPSPPRPRGASPAVSPLPPRSNLMELPPALPPDLAFLLLPLSRAFLRASAPPRQASSFRSEADPRYSEQVFQSELNQPRRHRVLCDHPKGRGAERGARIRELRMVQRIVELHAERQ